MKSHQGNPLLFGATHLGDTVWNFALFTTEKVTHLVIADYENQKEIASFALHESQHRVGDVWALTVEGLPHRFFYAWRIEDHLVIDPFARLLYTGSTWGENRWQKAKNSELFFAIASEPISYNWKAKSPEILTPCIYETHVRGMTIDPSSNVSLPGTWRGFTEKLNHIRSIGCNTIEFLPIYEFDETEWLRLNPENNQRLYNYWGYSPLHFFSPMQRYSSCEDPIEASLEFKACVDACHQKGLQVVLDVVYNHTGEGNEHGPSYSLKRLAEQEYYILDSDKKHTNFSGCGNTLNVNHPVTRRLIIESLQHWVTEYHVDGFRFDLAGTFMRGLQGEELPFSPILQEISADPLLKSKFLLLEPWDCYGIYKTGSLFSQELETPLFEWNDRFRDDVRRFIRGDTHQKGLFASRFAGSEDLYRNTKHKTHSINFITCHDGFSLRDLVSYNQKHNQANAEENHDGSNENCSWNCGEEGPTISPTIETLRLQQMKNFILALSLSKGIIMLHQGDEYGHTKEGNNNSWCQDNPINWFQWDKPLISFIHDCLSIRKKSPTFSSRDFYTSTDVDWHGIHPFEPNWDSGEKFLGLVTKTKEGLPEYYIGFLPSEESTLVTLPKYEGGRWQVKLFTSHKLKITSFQKILVPPFSSFLLEWK